MKTTYQTAVFKSYNNGYYTFIFENDMEVVFEEIRLEILEKYDLKNDLSLRNKVFNLAYSEAIEDDDDDFIILKIEYLELINTN